MHSEPFLKACTTLDPYSTRFHACERRAKCEVCRTFDRSGRRVWNMDKRVVHVNMVEVKTAAWSIQHASFVEALGKAAIGEGPWPYTIVRSQYTSSAHMLKGMYDRTARSHGTVRCPNSNPWSASSALAPSRQIP